MHLAKRFIAAAAIGSALLAVGCILKMGSGASSGSILAAAPQNAFLYEDFSGVADGALPGGWTGGDNIVVGPVGRGRGLYVSSSSDVNESVMSPHLAFPENFRIELIISAPSDCSSTFGEGFRVDVGSIGAGFEFSNCTQHLFFGGDRSKYVEIGNNAVLAVEKNRDVFSLWVNGKRYLLKRLSKYDPPDRIRMTFVGSRSQVIVHRIAGTPISSTLKPADDSQTSAR